MDIPVAGITFEFAETAARVGREKIHFHVGWGDVVGGGMTGFEQTIGTVGVCYGFAVELYAQVKIAWLDSWRARVVPDGFAVFVGLGIGHG